MRFRVEGFSFGAEHGNQEAGSENGSRFQAFGDYVFGVGGFRAPKP